jgi:hypothetical protein
MAGILEMRHERGYRPIAVRGRFRVIVASAALGLVGAVAPQGAAAAPTETVSCGEAITHSIVVGNDLSCGFEKPVLTVGADDITIDLNGHTIGGNWADALSSTGHTYVRIENGGLVTNVDGVSLTGDRHDTVRDVSASGGGEGSGVALSDGSQNSVLDSTLGGSPQPGLSLNNETGDVITGNTVSSIYNGLQITGGAGNQVTRNTTPTMSVSSSGSLIEANVLGPDPIAAGLVITGDQNSVIGNSVSGRPNSAGFDPSPEGISVTGSANVLSGNTAADSAGTGSTSSLPETRSPPTLRTTTGASASRPSPA